jgi:hypothetical protein
MRQAVVNLDFTPQWENLAFNPTSKRCVAFGLFRKRVPEPVAPAVEPKVPATAAGPDRSTRAIPPRNPGTSGPGARSNDPPARRHGSRRGLIRIFEQGVASGAISMEDMFDTGHNQRSYLIQSYARDMGNGKTVMMREIDVPIRVNGRHWGGFRIAYKL